MTALTAVCSRGASGTYSRYRGGESLPLRRPNPPCPCRGRRWSHLIRRAAAQGRQFGRRFRYLSSGSPPILRQADRAAAEFRRAGGDRDGERAADHRDARGFGAADRDRRGVAGHQQLARRPRAGVRRDARKGDAPVRRRAGNYAMFDGELSVRRRAAAGGACRARQRPHPGTAGRSCRIGSDCEMASASFTSRTLQRKRLYRAGNPEPARGRRRRRSHSCCRGAA